jgi:polyisoprenoid-binding protein YceI
MLTTLHSSHKMRVLDPKISVDKRAEIQQTMEGNAVFDAAHFPEISYSSSAMSKTGDAHWEVRGNLNLHGKSQPVVVVVSLEAGRYRGSASFKQSNFGINPIRIARETVKVKDEVKIEFDIVPVP